MKGFIKINRPDFYDIMSLLISQEFNQPEAYVKPILVSTLKPIFDLLIDTTSLYIETNYVDKIYRDSYYQYYASKASEFPRNCIRLSFFEDNQNRFVSGVITSAMESEVRSCYRGFLIVRPTLPSIIGRSAISPMLFKNTHFELCLVEIPSTVDGFKTSVKAFPSSSQDTESITCAETTLWALMEYYGNRYAEYCPIKPSAIINTLKNEVVGRQLPSNGLNAQHLTYAIKSFGFGPQLYHREVFPQLHNILGCYVESGIPVVVAISNWAACQKKTANEPINHAVLCVGHETVTDVMIDTAASQTSKLKNITTPNGNITVLDYDDIDKKYLFIDDNCPPYQLDALDKPADRYISQDWKTCQIENIIAPLYSKIYMEPYLAKAYVSALIESGYFIHLVNKNITIRTFLCSTRSYKEYIRTSTMSDDMKRVIEDIFMPKFIWVSEISDTDGLKNHVARNLIILDATGRQTSYFEPLLAAFTDTKSYVKDKKSNILVEDTINTKSFNSFYNIH